MAKGMDVKGVLSAIKKRPDKIDFLNRILKREGILKPRTRSAVYEVLGDLNLRANKVSAAYNAYQKSKTKEAYMKLAGMQEKDGNYKDAIWSLMDAGLSEKQVYTRIAKTAEEQGDYTMASSALEHIGEYKQANTMYKKYLMWGEKNRKRPLMELREKERSSQTIDSLVATVMLLSGTGILYMLFSKQEAIVSQYALLAPPFPNYLIYILPLVVIVGGIYFLWKKARKDIIPLSF